jgi:leucyl/phenylalanyl-tRNA--protein transferase
MQQLFKKQAFDFRINTAFSAVIQHCKSTLRPGQYGTWITNEVENAYNNLHKAGYAHSAEVWQNNQLVGGLYGIKMGKVFFGESMFSLVSNASKYAFISYVNQLVTEGIALIDCQIYTPHLESLGATMISRDYFMLLLDKYMV